MKLNKVELSFASVVTTANQAGCDTLYITYQPCPDCAAKMIEARTVQAVYYRDQDSKASTESIELLRGAGIYVNSEWLNV